MMAGDGRLTAGRGLLFSLLVALILVASLHAPMADAIQTGLKSYRLGMTLKDLKGLPIPEAANRIKGESDPMLFCSDDNVVKKAPSNFFDLKLSPELAKAGVVRCAHYMKITEYGTTNYQVVAIRIAGGPHALVSFYFLPGGGDRLAMQIFSIVALISPEDYSVVRSALEEKYGHPASSDDSPFVNQLGGQLDNVKASWDFGDATVAAIKRDGYAKTGSISYIHKQLKAELDDKLKESAAKAASDL